MPYHFADRMAYAPESFLGTLFAVSGDPDIISFAGGLPSSELIDTKGITEATRVVLEEDGSEALQYSTTDGYLPLREYIAKRYRQRYGLSATADEIRIVNGSQQNLDLLAKIFLNPGDGVGLEAPGYLGSIEAFSLYQPTFCPVPLTETGPDPNFLEKTMREKTCRFFYGIPNFQNPSGTSYSDEARRHAGLLARETGTIFYEDDAFGELAFDGRARIPVKKYAREYGIISGSFSKIVAPGLRCGWIYAPSEIIAQFDIAKQSADLHSNFLSQKILHRYLTTTDLDQHVRRVASVYERNCRLMGDLIDDIFGGDLIRTHPEGGMFIWATLPKGIDARDLFEAGVKEQVAIMPGMPFYVEDGGHDAIRLNFSNACEDEISEGMIRLKTAFDRCR